MARVPRARIREKSGPPTRVCKREGSLCTCEGREAVSEKRKKEKKERKTNHKKKLEKGSSVEREVWNSTSQNKKWGDVVSHPRTRWGRGRVPDSQCEGREGESSSREEGWGWGKREATQQGWRGATRPRVGDVYLKSDYTVVYTVVCSYYVATLAFFVFTFLPGVLKVSRSSQVWLWGHFGLNWTLTSWSLSCRGHNRWLNRYQPVGISCSVSCDRFQLVTTQLCWSWLKSVTTYFNRCVL